MSASSSRVNVNVRVSMMAVRDSHVCRPHYVPGIGVEVIIFLTLSGGDKLMNGKRSAFIRICSRCRGFFLQFFRSQMSSNPLSSVDNCEGEVEVFLFYFLFSLSLLYSERLAHHYNTESLHSFIRQKTSAWVGNTIFCTDRQTHNA